jgi:hypothetical protein
MFNIRKLIVVVVVILLGGVSFADAADDFVTKHSMHLLPRRWTALRRPPKRTD